MDCVRSLNTRSGEKLSMVHPVEGMRFLGEAAGRGDEGMGMCIADNNHSICS